MYFLDYVNGGELFTHLYQRESFTEDQVRIYIAEIILALEQLHKVSIIQTNNELNVFGAIDHKLESKTKDTDILSASHRSFSQTSLLPGNFSELCALNCQ